MSHNRQIKIARFETDIPNTFHYSIGIYNSAWQIQHRVDGLDTNRTTGQVVPVGNPVYDDILVYIDSLTFNFWADELINSGRTVIAAQPIFEGTQEQVEAKLDHDDFGLIQCKIMNSDLFQ